MNQKNNIKKYVLNSSLAKEVTDIYSILQDLQYAKYLFEKSYNIAKNPDEKNNPDRHHFWQLGIVYYGRAFDTRGRRKFKSKKYIEDFFNKRNKSIRTVVSLNDKIIKEYYGDQIPLFHDFLLGTRNQFIAHAVSELEERQCTIFFNHTTNIRCGFGIHNVRHFWAKSAAYYDGCIKACEFCIEKIKIKYDDCFEKLRSEIALLKDDELKTLPEQELPKDLMAKIIKEHNKNIKKKCD